MPPQHTPPAFCTPAYNREYAGYVSEIGYLWKCFLSFAIISLISQIYKILFFLSKVEDFKNVGNWFSLQSKVYAASARTGQKRHDFVDKTLKFQLALTLFWCIVFKQNPISNLDTVRRWYDEFNRSEVNRRKLSPHIFRP